MEAVIEILNYPFIRRALIVGVLVSVCAAMLGVILVLNRYSLIGHGLSEVGFAALALALALGFSPLLVSIPIVVTASFLIMLISQKKGGHGDVSIAIVSTGALAAGVIITSLSGGFSVDVSGYMFGSILSMNMMDVYLSIAISVMVLILYCVFYNRLLIIAFDESYAKASGINTSFYQFLISFLTAITVVLGMRMMGTLLISGLIIFPAMIARKLVKSFKAVVIVSAAVSVVCFITGMLISFILDLPTGASVVMVDVVVLALVSAANPVKRRG